MKKALQSPKGRGTKAAGVAVMIWTILVQTGWLTKWAWYLDLPQDFFYDEHIAGYCTIFITWLVREIRELTGGWRWR